MLPQLLTVDRVISHLAAVGVRVTDRSLRRPPWDTWLRRYYLGGKAVYKYEDLATLMTNGTGDHGNRRKRRKRSAGAAK